ncbi:MAG: hypothetical protein JRF72_19050 [Deltaproteobacteria bacterium]|nr:hypothetical protein [Deltaproteobacteria bacterium]
MSAKKKAASLKNKTKSNLPKTKDGKIKPGPGRPKGTKNKFTQVLVDLVFDIEKELTEKKKGLKDCAEQDPKWFYEKFLSKLLPKPVDVSADVSGEFTFKWEK